MREPQPVPFPFWKFPERLKLLRKERRMNLRELGEALGVTRNTILNWEENGFIGKADFITAIAEYFNVSMDWLVGRTDVREMSIIPTEQTSTDVISEVADVVSKFDEDDLRSITQFLTIKYLEVRRRR